MAVRNMIITGLFSALLAVSSQVYIPGPVPHTIQILVVLLAGWILGSRWGPVSVIVWIMLGLFGLPVFAQGKAGIAVLVGPTGGFLIGFVLAAWLIGHASQRQRPFLAALAVMTGAVVVIYAVGLAGFMACFTWILQKPMTWDKAFSVAVLPFLPFDVIKAAAAAYLAIRLQSALHKGGLKIEK